MKKDEILAKLKELKPKYAKDGIIIKGLFGSYARGEEHEKSDIDIAYVLDEPLFFSKYRGFCGASKLALVAREIEEDLKHKIDFISLNSVNHELNETILKDLAV